MTIQQNQLFFMMYTFFLRFLLLVSKGRILFIVLSTIISTMSKKKKPSDDDYSVDSTNASELIRQAIKGNISMYNSNTYDPAPSKIIRSSKSDSFEYHAGITISPSKDAHSEKPSAVAKGSQSDVKNKRWGDKGFEIHTDEEEEEHVRQRRKKRRDKFVPQATTSSTFSNSDNNLCNQALVPKVVIKQEKIERKKVTIPNDKKKEYMPPVSSVTVRKSIDSYSSSVRDVCLFCKNQANLCHDKVYSDYCLQAARSYLYNNDDGWLEGFSPARMERVFATAYNEIRRADLFQKFSYYNPETFKVPKCMELGSMCDAVDLGFKTEVDQKLKRQNDDGMEMFYKAKLENRS